MHVVEVPNLETKASSRAIHAMYIDDVSCPHLKVKFPYFAEEDFLFD